MEVPIPRFLNGGNNVISTMGYPWAIVHIDDRPDPLETMIEKSAFTIAACSMCVSFKCEQEDLFSSWP